MTVQELQEIISQPFDAQEQHFHAQFDAQEQRQTRIEARTARLEDKLDKMLELVATQHGQPAFAARFWKHAACRTYKSAQTKTQRFARFWKYAAWLTPTFIALAALIKRFFL